MSSDQQTPLFPYEGIRAIIVSWSDDDLDLYCELVDINNAFAFLNFTHHRMYFIPSQNPFDSLLEKINHEKPNAAAENSLLVVYYGEDGQLLTNRRLHFTATRESQHPSIDWTSMQANLESANTDVLLLLDCCHASAAASSFEQSYEDDPEPRKRLEILAGCGYDSVTREAGRYSFTKALIAKLNERGKLECVFSVGQLFQSLHARMLRQHPSNIPDSDDDKYNKCFVAPVYIPRCTDPIHVSIPLRKLDSPKKEDASDQQDHSVDNWRYPSPTSPSPTAPKHADW
ncbi:hypothetical protein ONS95_008414 [Cadophora gregata]|uniref:uncharacterized protein n=1 Tax=Cadophora gregata TaxID=51156 RepID=UPI0026DCD8DB|nr:uncharacterized protein ONS95_008414 [Cadophora gregata]KAK0126835.1 hypothetical protein ONS95_008414 [Cadophora gregata]